MFPLEKFDLLLSLLHPPYGPTLKRTFSVIRRLNQPDHRFISVEISTPIAAFAVDGPLICGVVRGSGIDLLHDNLEKDSGPHPQTTTKTVLLTPKKEIRNAVPEHTHLQPIKGIYLISA